MYGKVPEGENEQASPMFCSPKVNAAHEKQEVYNPNFEASLSLDNIML